MEVIYMGICIADSVISPLENFLCNLSVTALSNLKNALRAFKIVLTGKNVYVGRRWFK